MLRRSLRFLAVTAADIESKLLNDATIKPTSVKVRDVSSGCGSFFHVEVTSPVFAGKMLIQQHRLVNEALRAEIKEIHGLTIDTRLK